MLAILLLFPLTAVRAADGFPPFSWDHVPVYAHVGKRSDDFTPAQLDFLARHFNFITIEKGQASRKRGSTEAGFAEAARQIKQRNPEAKVLFYWNTTLDIPGYEARGTFPAGGHLDDAQGQPVRVRETLPMYDLSRADVREWWSDTAAKAVREYGADGIFADALGKASTQRNRRLLGEEKYKALNAGLVAMLKETREKLGPDKLVIFNGIGHGGGREFLPITSGAMIEHFGYFSSADKESMATDMERIIAVGRAGKIVVCKAWPGFSWLDKNMMKKPHAELAQLARERITFPLACFLVAAEPNCYFCYTWGYQENDGTFDWYPEFDKPLGPPKAEAVRQPGTWIFRREFEHARVTVDLEKEEGAIQWLAN